MGNSSSGILVGMEFLFVISEGFCFGILVIVLLLLSLKLDDGSSIISLAGKKAHANSCTFIIQCSPCGA